MRLNESASALLSSLSIDLRPLNLDSRLIYYLRPNCNITARYKLEMLCLQLFACLSIFLCPCLFLSLAVCLFLPLFLSLYIFSSLSACLSLFIIPLWVGNRRPKSQDQNQRLKSKNKNKIKTDISTPNPKNSMPIHFSFSDVVEC